ncbi:MAG: hypothetical protein NTU84_11415 [Verrucomicrobia bacterium]|nr:hypothetical protein [Verrucomicrobiota bacterium]
MALSDLRGQMPAGGLFGGGSWRWSPEPLVLSQAEADGLAALGHPLARFQQACDEIYRRSAAGSLPSWIAEWLDRGKPEWLVALQRAKGMAGHAPRVIRPDLMVTQEGFAMSELDSVPGGIGVAAWMARVYADAGYEVLGGADGMRDGFRSLMPDGGTVLISEEAADYRPEMEWLVSTLGDEWRVASAESYEPDGSALYRFFEWSPALKGVWEKSLRGNYLKRLREVVPFGWLVDPTPLPPHAALPRLELHSWDEVAGLSQRERQLVLKVSGFHETAWGSRGVFVGHDLPAGEWSARLRHALDHVAEQPWVMQQFREARRIQHPVFRDDGSIEVMQGRARICPYYFTDDEGTTQLGGCLATIVPADKKKIHGMSDGVLVPCVVG